METTAKKTIESKAAETITQQPITVSVNGIIYKAAPPSLATLCRVSRLVSLLPGVGKDAEGSVFCQSLRIARGCSWLLAEICATLILGGKRIDESGAAAEAKKTEKQGRWVLRRHKKASTAERSELDRLTGECYYSMTPSLLRDTVYRLLSGMEIGDFFGLTASLAEANLLKAGEAEETAPGA